MLLWELEPVPFDVLTANRPAASVPSPNNRLVCLGSSVTIPVTVLRARHRPGGGPSRVLKIVRFARFGFCPFASFSSDRLQTAQLGMLCVEALI
jgi:hypothetical protein